MRTTPDVLLAAGYEQVGADGQFPNATAWYDGELQRKVVLFDDGRAFGYLWTDYAHHGVWYRADEEFEDVDVERAIANRDTIDSESLPVTADPAVRSANTARLLGNPDAPQGPPSPGLPLAAQLAELDNEQLIGVFCAALNSRDDVHDVGRAGVDVYLVPISDGTVTEIGFCEYEGEL